MLMDLLVEYIMKKEIKVRNVDKRPVYEMKLTREEIKTFSQPLLDDGYPDDWESLEDDPL